MRLIIIFIILLGLGGCASAITSSACTNIISGTGALLQFCPNHQEVAIAETGLAHRDDAVKVVNDPATLKALAQNLKLNDHFKRSRRIIAHACVVRDATYVSLRASDLDRLLHEDRLNEGPNSF